MTTTTSNERQARPPSYSITNARYAKKSIAVHCKSDGSGFKTLAMHATESIGGRWSNREKAYILPASKEARLRQLLDEQRAGRE